MIVDDSFRGKGIGKEMLLSVFKLAKKDKLNKLQILTDESCNYKFYEKLGCKKIYETSVDTYDKFKERVFIYEKIL